MTHTTRTQHWRQALSNKRLKSVNQTKRRDADGVVRTKIVVQWEDGRKEIFGSANDVPDDIKQQIRKFKAKAKGSVQTSTKSVAKSRSKKSDRGGGILGTKWKVVADQLEIDWPTIRFAPPAGCFGLILCFAFSLGAYFSPSKYGHLWPWIIGGVFLCFLLLVGTCFLREKFVLNRQNASISRWPAVFNRHRLAVPIDSVLSAIVRLEIAYSQRTSKIGFVQVRVKRPEGIDWWDIGSEMSWSEAESIGRLLSRFIDVQIQRND